MAVRKQAATFCVCMIIVNGSISILHLHLPGWNGGWRQWLYGILSQRFCWPLHSSDFWWRWCCWVYRLCYKWFAWWRTGIKARLFGLPGLRTIRLPGKPAHHRIDKPADRFRTWLSEKNFRRLLWRNDNFPPFFHIVPVDKASGCSLYGFGLYVVRMYAH